MGMKGPAKRAVITLLMSLSAILSFAPGGGLNDAAAGDNKAGQDMLIASATAEELLMYFEEKDLVLATRHEISLRKAPAIATVITAQEIRNMGARNLTDVLKTVPGIGVSINEFGDDMFEVRGIRTQISEKILVMIDGHPMNLIFTGSALRDISNNHPVENIKQIEVVRGPGSALYGANAFVAVINIVTKEADDISGIEVKGAYGSFDTRHMSLIGGKVFGEDIRVEGSIDYYKSEGARLRIKEDILTGTPFTTTPGKSLLSKEQTDVFLKTSYGDLVFRGWYMSKETTGAYIGMGYALTDDTSHPVVNYGGEVSYSRVFNERVSSSIKLFYDYYQQESDVEVMPEGLPGYPDGMIGRPWLKNRNLGGELQVDYDISDRNHLVAGALYKKIRQYDVIQYANFDPVTGAPLGYIQEVADWNRNVNKEIWAIYLQDEWQLRENLTLTTGLRYDHYSDFGDTTNPRIGLVWGFLKNADLKLLYGQAFRAPNFVELYNQNNPVNIGNPDLKPEKIQTYEAGLALRPGKSFSVDLNYFYSRIKDIIVWDASTSPALHVNAGEAQVDGVELVLTGQYTKDNYWKLSYTYQDPEDADTGQRLPYVPLHRVTGSVNYGLTKYVNLHSDVLWTGERSRPEGDTRNDVASFTAVDVAVTLKNFYKTLEIQGTVHNLFDEKYEDPDTSGAAQYIPNDFPRDGISVMVNVSYKF